MKTLLPLDCFAGWFTVVAALSLTMVSRSPSAHAAELRTAALSGQTVPGTASGVTYESFGTLIHPLQFYRHGGPVLNDAGQVAFRANLAGDGVDFTNNQGVWSEGAGSLALVARTGNQAPGAPNGVNFSTDSQAELFFPVLNNSGQTAFYAATTDGGLGLWSEGSGSLAPVARTGDHAPGTPGGVTFNFASLYSYLESPVLNDAGQTSFRSRLSGSGVTSANLHGLWSEGSGSLEMLARLGNQAPGLPPGVRHGYTFSAGLNDAGSATFFSILTGTGVNSSNNFSIWSNLSGSPALLIRTGDQAPGMPSGVTIDALSNNAAINNAGQVAFIAGLSTHNLEYGFAESLWLADSSGMKILAVRGTQAPGTPSGVMFDEITYWPVLNDAGQVLFGTIFMGDGIDASNNSALYLSDAIGNINLILRLGDQAPGTPAGTVFAPNDDGAFVLNNAGQVVVGQRLAGPEVDFSNDYGIWATDHEGDQQLIARKGDELAVAPGDLRTISDLSFVGIAANSNGWPSAFNDLGQLAFWASFTDGTQGVFVSNKVAHIPGDFNNDGTVDAADYVVWRKTDGTQAGYDSWRANFGRTVAAGGSVAAATEPPVTTAAVPEPSAAVLVTLAIVTCFVTAIRELDADRGRRRCFAERRWHEEIG